MRMWNHPTVPIDCVFEKIRGKINSDNDVFPLQFPVPQINVLTYMQKSHSAIPC
jgi:hypothetical protein